MKDIIRMFRMYTTIPPHEVLGYYKEICLSDEQEKMVSEYVQKHGYEKIKNKK
jgi:hypothetical protein